MSEWKEYNITDVCDTISDTYKDGATKVVLVNTSDVLEGKVTNHEFVPNKNLAGQFKKKFQKDDILYSEIRPANRRYAYVDFEPKDYIASTKLMVLRSKPCILPKYLYYLLTNNTTIHNLHAIAVGRSGTFPQITYSELANIKFRLPSLDEQDEILTTLLYFDSKIAVNRRICENLEAQAQALFKHWFIDFAPFKNGNFCANREQNETSFNSAEVQPKITGKACKFVESELGMIPEGWRVGTLGEICTYSSKKIAISQLTNTSYYSTENMLPNKAGAMEASSLPKVEMTTGCLPYDVLVSNIRPYFKKIIRVETTCGCSTDVLCFHPVDTKYMSYMYRVLYDDSFFAYVMAGSKGTKMPRGDKQQIMKYPIVIPTNSVLEEYSILVEPMFELISSSNKENLRLSTLRDTLLPKLMSGQIKV